MKIRIDWKFKKDFPVLAGWMDLRVDQAYRVPTRVDRQKVPKGELFPLTRNKGLFALLQAVQPMFKPHFKLKDFAALLEVSYHNIRHWNRDERVKDRTLEYARNFVEYFGNTLVEEALWFGRPEARDDVWLPDRWSNLIMEASQFGGVIERVFTQDLSELLRLPQINQQARSKMLEFVDKMMWLKNLKKSEATIENVVKFYELARELTRTSMENCLNSFEAQLPSELREMGQSIKTTMLSILDRQYSWEIQDNGEKLKFGKKTTTKGGLRDPVDVAQHQLNK